ncbi:MAG: SDR family NAD(P)-dependent oxidoreductase [Acidobacteriia bacterium]|nr:SDR family NAD(P)-dependent oxidoreductase [Terriglobia bacterium]
MQLSSNTVLITGGASGIGLALAERFLKAGSKVIICGRREDKLQEAKARHPEFTMLVCDVGTAADRIALSQWATSEFPGLNVLVNNAGIQRRIQFPLGEDWNATRQEIAINLEAPIHLASLFIPHLQKQQRPAIINVTSGLSFVPLATVPVYCSTKAALHSFTLSLRHQLSKTPIQVIEIAPPAVNTDLGGPGLHTFGVPLDEFADAAMARLATDELEIAYGFAQKSSRASREELDAMFAQMNNR